MLPGHVCQHRTPSLVPRSQSQGCLMSPDSSWPRYARTARGMPGGGPKDMDTSHRCKDLVRGVGDLVEVQPTPWGKSGAKWWIPNQDHGHSGHGPSALQGHDCAAMLSKEMLTMFRMISIKTSFIQPGGGSVIVCTLQRGNSDESRVVHTQILLQWRAEKQKPVSHHHPEDSQL